MKQEILNALIIKNKEERMECNCKLLHSDNELKDNMLKNSMLGDYLCKKFNEEHGIILKSSNKTIPEQMHELVNHILSPRELKVYCITDDK